MTTDKLATSGGQAVASISYGYDPNGNLTSKTTSGFAGASANTYTYDGANRLTSWNNGTTTVNYAYDGAGNRIQAGNETLTYDARDELTSTQAGSGPVTTYAYTARGTLKSITSPSGTVSYTSNAYGQPVTQGTQSFTYDALGRAVSDSGTAGSYTLGYVGQSNQVASDGTWNYTYDPSGGLAAIGPAGGTTAQGVLAYTDQHTDLVGTFAPAGAALAGSASYSPLGAVTAGSGLAGNLGYQSGFTDPANSLVDMAARWYSPGTGEFTTRDTAIIDPVPDPAAANPFAYAGDHPLTATDPSGHLLVGSAAGGARTPPARRVQQPPPPTCSGWDIFCDASHVWHHYVAPYIHHVVHIVVVTLADGLRNLPGLLSDAVAAVGHLSRDVATSLADAARQGAHAVVSGVRAAVAAGAAVTHHVARWASSEYHQATHAVSDAWHAVAHAANAVTSFIKNHAATIASFVVSAAVFVGCDAALGVATGGVGALAGAAACGALAGAAGNAVSYGITAAQTGDFSWTGLTDSAATGALAGAVGGLAGGLAASGLSAIGDAATSLLGDGAQSIADDASANAAATGTDDTAVLATSPDSADVTGAAENSALSDAPDEAGLGPSCGGASFTAATRVLLASGAAVPIAALHRGEKVLATSTRTGKTRAEAVAAVLVHHDTNRYNLTIRTAHGTAVIHTTRTHLFWAPAAHRWVKAAALRHGTHLATPGRGTATVTGGHTPGTRTDWMWDLTIPADHDFYITARNTAVLVHNCDSGEIPYKSDELSSAAYVAREQAGLGPGRNVAAAKLPGWNDPRTGDIVIGFSREGTHSEEGIINQVLGRGFDPQDIVGLYTERSPCPACAAMLNDSLKEGTPISWSVPYGDTPLLRQAATDLLARMITQARGG